MSCQKNELSNNIVRVVDSWLVTSLCCFSSAEESQQCKQKLVHYRKKIFQNSSEKEKKSKFYANQLFSAHKNNELIKDSIEVVAFNSPLVGIY